MLCFKRNVKISFNGGNIISNSRLILYSESAEKIVFLRTITYAFNVNDTTNHRKNKNKDDILLQKDLSKNS